MKKFFFCNNCGKNGHLYHKCKKPINSMGVIAFRKNKKNIEYLMICRKNSMGFVDFVRGKYPIYADFYIQNIINEMTQKEKKYLETFEFKDLWHKLWGNYIGCQYRSEALDSIKKFSFLKKNNKIKQYIKNSKTCWKDPEWGFPKGRRNNLETDIMCALREFEEETGIDNKSLILVKNLMTFDEIFMGSNLKIYKTKYFLGEINENVDINNFQREEVSKIKWCTLNDCLKNIRPYNFERREKIKKIDYVLKNYQLV